MVIETDTLTFETSDGLIKLERTDMLFFLDETGHEKFCDKQFPLFGLGGVGTSVGYYVDTLRPVWNYMKNEYFGGTEREFHAADLRNPTKDQIEALNTYFRDYQFLRIAAMTTNKTVFCEDVIPIQITSLCLQQRLLDVLSKQFPFTKLYLIFEENQRIERDIQRFFSNFEVLERDGDDVFVIGAFLPKKAVEPGLEIADTIMHTTGAQVRNCLRDPKASKRKDWTAIWETMPDNLISYMEVNKVI